MAAPIIEGGVGTEGMERRRDGTLRGMEGRREGVQHEVSISLLPQAVTVGIASFGKKQIKLLFEMSISFSGTNSSPWAGLRGQTRAEGNV